MDPRDLKHMNPKLAPDAEPATEALDLVAEAHTRVRDTVEGMEKLVEKAEADFKPTAQTLLTMHRRHEADLHAYLTDQGHDAQADGSVFGSVNRAVVEVRSWVDDISDNVMQDVKEGEKHVLDAYRAAEGAENQPKRARDMLARHSAEIDAAMRAHA